MTEIAADAETLFSERGSAWFDAVTERRSRRAYSGSAAPESDLLALERVCREFRPRPGARVELVREPAENVFRGAVGNYGKVTGAPHLLVIIATDDRAGHLAAGYAGEAALLEATALGLATCWVGGFFDRDKVAALVELADGERALAVSPVGYPQGVYTVTERLMRGMASAHSRKPLETIAPELDESWPGWARAAVECARLAPSAVNRQPWRFGMSGGALVLGKDGGPDYPAVTKELDCGIAMLHAELGARQCGAAGTWSLAQGHGVELARFELSGAGSPTC